MHNPLVQHLFGGDLFSSDASHINSSFSTSERNAQHFSPSLSHSTAIGKIWLNSGQSICGFERLGERKEAKSTVPRSNFPLH
jgi:hypothetical protein